MYVWVEILADLEKNEDNNKLNKSLPTFVHVYRMRGAMVI